MSKSPRKQPVHKLSFKTKELISTPIVSERQSPKKIFEEKEFLSKEAYFEKIKQILLKTQRSQIELFLLQKYLSTLPSLMSILSESPGNIENLLSTIALQLKYERIPSNTIICRLGEKGNKFYIILKGTVSILIPKEIIINMTLFQYVQHLLLLLICEEKELLSMTIKQNKFIYSIEIDMLNQFIQHYQKINVAFLTFDGVEVLQLKNFVGMTIANHYSLSVRTVSEYIKESDPQLGNTTNKNNSELLKSNLSKSVSLYVYFEVTKLMSGGTFGERALITSKNKRTATILSEPGVSLGILTRKGFDLCIKDIQKKIQHGNIHFFQSFKIFSTLSWYLFSSKFLNFFKLQTLKQNEMLIKENNDSNEIFFVREGEFEVTAKMDEDDIEYYINLLKHKRRYRVNNSSDLKKKLLRIALFKEKDIIGLDDMTHHGKYIFSVRCISFKAIVFGIEVKAFETIAHKIKDVFDSLKEFIAVRKDMFLSRLESYRYILSTQTSDKEIRHNTPLDRVRDCFSARPKSINREKINQKTQMTPIKNKQLFLETIAKTESKNVVHLKPYITTTSTANKNNDYCELNNINDHCHKEDNVDEKQLITVSLKPEILQYKSRNNRPLSQCDTYTLTTTNLITMTNNNNNNNDCGLGIRDTKRLKLSIQFSQLTWKKTRRDKKPFSNYKPEKFLKQIVGTSYRKNDKKQLFLSDIIKQNHTKSISRDKETIINIIDFDKYDTQMTHSNSKPLELIDKPFLFHHKALSPKQLPLNYMEKAKPLRLSIKKKRSYTYTTNAHM